MATRHSAQAEGKKEFKGIFASGMRVLFPGQKSQARPLRTPVIPHRANSPLKSEPITLI